MPTHSNYDPFAYVYNKHWGGDYALYVLPILEELVLPHLPDRAGILDLCCGTGQLAQLLTERGYQVTGIDASEGMLRFARENAPTAEFIQNDARSFKLPAVYHAVVSTFDSLNHIMTLDELTSAFHNVYAVLREEGLFFFDLNMEAGYRVTWNDNFGIVEDDHVCVVRSGYDTATRTAEFKTTIFSLQGKTWQRSDVTLLQKCYSDAEVRSALESTGFSDIRAYGYDDKGDLAELTEEAERAFFVCQKPAKADRR